MNLNNKLMKEIMSKKIIKKQKINYLIYKKNIFLNKINIYLTSNSSFIIIDKIFLKTFIYISIFNNFYNLNT